MPDCCVVSPAAVIRCRIAGASWIRIQRSWMFCREVMSPALRPNSLEMRPIAASCSEVSIPLGMRSRIMKWPGVALRWKRPYHLSRSKSSGSKSGSACAA